MNFDGMKETAQWNSVLYHDNSALGKIKHSRDEQGALEQVAGQFEAMFLQLVLRQMRASSDALADEDSPFSSQQFGVFRDMHDGQLAIEMAQNQQAGIADMLVRQLSPRPLGEAFNETLHARPQNKIDAVPLVAANEATLSAELEARSQVALSASAGMASTINLSNHLVASLNQPCNSVATSSAFAQSLLRPQEL
ncbi:flagellar protein [Vibrio sp. SM6]|uniref:Flagellar protein n=1 Tax=Vibrio agarilyticus TaxID=2726741 RepID=A0A7X8TRZ1_9VIBR|nr:rod-binding protein [Vibrio agarilyticus]NLS13728.1 flagellar protein [Vibrio agarilyticus]